MDMPPSQGSPQDREPLSEDPESPADIVRDNVLFLFPVALGVLLGVFALVMGLAG
jgi:hypothetical protein